MVMNHQRLLESIDLSPLAMVVSNPRRQDNPLEMVNSAFCELTGYTEAEVLGRNCRFLAGQGSDEAASAMIRSGIEEKRPVLVEILNYRRDGSAFRNGVMITPLFGAEGQAEWFLGSQVRLDAKTPNGFADRHSRALNRISSLPPRQREVLRLMAKGLLNKQIAWEMKISEKTVKMHRSLLLENLGVQTSADAIRICVEAEF